MAATYIIYRTGGYTHEDRHGIPVMGTIWQVRHAKTGVPAGDYRTKRAAVARQRALNRQATERTSTD